LWAAHSKPSHTTTTPQLASFRPRKALRPLNRSPSAPHRFPDARRRLTPPPSSLPPPIARIPKLVSPIDCISTFPITHWSLRVGPSPTLAAGASPSLLTPPAPLRAPIEILLSGHPHPRQVVHSNRREPLELLLPSDLAADGPLHRNMAVFSLFLFLLQPRAFLERFEKFEGSLRKITEPPPPQFKSYEP
jgi:hypothetical protein